MKVYLVFKEHDNLEYIDTNLLGVFTTFEKAKKVLDEVELEWGDSVCMYSILTDGEKKKEEDNSFIRREHEPKIQTGSKETTEISKEINRFLLARNYGLN